MATVPDNPTQQPRILGQYDAEGTYDPPSYANIKELLNDTEFKH